MKMRGGFQFTLTELLLGVAGFAILLSVLMPFVQQAREQARLNHCLNNMKQIGFGFQNMDSALRRFPASCGVKRNEAGEIVAMDGWSWCVEILPFMYHKPLYDSLDISNGTPLVETAEKGTPHADALATVLEEFHCPSFSGTTHIDMKTKAEAITNYKAMGATHLESLNVASTRPTVPKYEGVDHPDGGIYPGSTHGTEAIMRDGTACIILVVELKEQNVARWTVGNETCVVGLPPVVTFEEADPSLGIPFPYPTGFADAPDKYRDESGIPTANNKT